MHWLKQLADMYGERDVPLFHDEVYTDIEVSISADGRFVGARRRRIRTIIPVTERSAVRTSGIQPHPLCDSLSYTAGDLCQYIGNIRRISERSAEYLKQLGEWAGSSCATDELRAVYRYLSGKTLFGDISATGVLDGIPEMQVQKMVVRFKVGGIKLFEDSRLRQSHIAHTRMQLRNDTLCCLSGELSAAARLHPKRITDSSSSAKLISGAMLPIGYELSFRAHAVLRRLISEEGIRLGSKVFVAWEGAADGEMTVLVLHEINRGNLAVTLLGQLNKELYQQVKRQLLQLDCGNGNATALEAERYLARELKYRYELQEIK